MAEARAEVNELEVTVAWACDVSPVSEPWLKILGMQICGQGADGLTSDCCKCKPVHREPHLLSPVLCLGKRLRNRARGRLCKRLGICGADASHRSTPYRARSSVS